MLHEAAAVVPAAVEAAAVPVLVAAVVAEEAALLRPGAAAEMLRAVVPEAVVAHRCVAPAVVADHRCVGRAVEADLALIVARAVTERCVVRGAMVPVPIAARGVIREFIVARVVMVRAQTADHVATMGTVAVMDAVAIVPGGVVDGSCGDQACRSTSMTATTTVIAPGSTGGLLPPAAATGGIGIGVAARLGNRRVADV